MGPHGDAEVIMVLHHPELDSRLRKKEGKSIPAKMEEKEEKSSERTVKTDTLKVMATDSGEEGTNKIS